MKSGLSLGIHECSYIDSFADDRTELFPFLRECGFSYVEFSVLNNYSDERARFLKEELLEAGLGASCCSCLPEGASFVGRGEASYKLGIDYLKKCVDFCGAIGSGAMSGILYSGWGCGDLNVPKQKKWELAAPAIQEAAEYAADKGVVLCLEVLNRYESDYINTLQEGRCFLELVNRKNVKLLADVFHMNIEEADIGEAIRRHADIIGNIHISENNRDFPGNNATIDWHKLADSIKASGYTGGICYECSVKKGTEVGKAFNTWRTLAPGDSLKERLYESAAFIKGLL